jgi:surface antigen
MKTTISALGLCALVATYAPASAQIKMPSVAVDDVAKEAGSSAGVFGCSAPGSKQKIGAAAGAVVGGIAGNRVVKGKRVLGTVIGGAAGGALGSWIGCKLQLKDQQKAQKALSQAAAENKSQQWSNTETGASGSATLLAGGGIGGLRFPQNVLPYSQYDERSGIFAPNGRVNLRAAPSTSSEIVGSINAGENVEVVAGAANSPWLLVSENGIARGYVSEPLMVQQSAALQANCKLIRQEIRTASEGTASQDFKACPDANGGWLITQA